jgi:hypothetical protein
MQQAGRQTRINSLKRYSSRIAVNIIVSTVVRRSTIISVISEHLLALRTLNLNTCFSLLAVYDLGAPANVLQAIYDAKVKSLRPIDMVDKKELEPMTGENWTNFLGQEKSASSVGLAMLILTNL